MKERVEQHTRGENKGEKQHRYRSLWKLVDERPGSDGDHEARQTDGEVLKVRKRLRSVLSCRARESRPLLQNMQANRYRKEPDCVAKCQLTGEHTSSFAVCIPFASSNIPANEEGLSRVIELSTGWKDDELPHWSADERKRFSDAS